MIPRKDLEKLLKQASNHSISVIIGARQVGKSTLLGMLREGLNQPSEVFNLENPLHLSLFNEGYTSFIRTIRTKLIFIDEFQYCSNISSVFKATYDLNPEVKIYATGSSSMEIQTHLKESLAGRKLETPLYPLTYGEWLNRDQTSQGLSKGLALPDSSGTVEKLTPPDELEAHRRNLREYLCYGGLPGLVALSDDLEKREYLFGIYQTYIAKDIKAFLKEESVLAFNKAITWLALHNGSQLNKTTLCGVAGISSRQIDRYLDVLVGTFVLALLPPLSTNRGKELTRTPKFYLYDQGVINSIIQDFRDIELRSDAGTLREQFVFWELKKNIDIRFSLYYWRTADGKEVDFVLKKDQELLPIEVKSDWHPPALPNGLRHFLGVYPETRRAAVLYNGPEFTQVFGQCTVYFLPIHKACMVPAIL
ncbi:MAG TPA: ATP-binding protein [Spirochaetales bacterium]|nr:ATP-binding protein [Spirochaetales bacterium]